MFPGAASSLNTPPTPFADRESLEAELKALEKDIDHIQQLKMLNGWGLENLEADNLSDGSSLNSYEDNEAREAAGLAAVYQLRDIDSFIANVTVPPPPRSFIDPKADEDDISAFIIPPPPSAASTASKVSSVDRDVNEVKVSKEIKEKISPKIASIQQKFLQDSNFKGLQDTLTRKKSPNGTETNELPPPPPPPRSAAPKKYEFGQVPQPPRPSKLSLDNVVQVKNTLSKMSLTSSSDSLSSTASLNTVKSVSPSKEDDEEPPSLPPRQSPSKSPSKPPVASPEVEPTSGSKPVVPSRASKPQMSPMRALPPVPKPPPPAPPSPPPLVSKSYPGTPVKKVIICFDFVMLSKWSQVSSRFF